MRVAAAFGTDFFQSRKAAEFAVRERRQILAARDGRDYPEWLFPRGYSLWQRRVRRIVRQIILASEVTKHGAALVRSMVADGAAEHGIASFKRVEDGALRHWASDF
jgi:hypothetical protein